MIGWIVLIIVCMILLGLISLAINESMGGDLDTFITDGLWNPVEHWKQLDKEFESMRLFPRILIKGVVVALIWTISIGVYFFSLRWMKNLVFKKD